MGYYLTFPGNRKANPATGAVPDENYARELMQLFTIGLLKLNPDGSLAMGPAPRARPTPRTTLPASPASSPAGTSTNPPTTRRRDRSCAGR